MRSEVIDDQGQTKLMTKFYWSRVLGKFVNKHTGQPVNLSTILSIGPAFTGTVREWYETLIETIVDIYNCVPEPTNNVYVGPNVAIILESSMLFKLMLPSPEFPFTSLVKLGSIVGHDVYVDPSLTNTIKIGHHNGGSWYEGEIEVLDMNII
jgi:hypothetical protein